MFSFVRRERSLSPRLGGLEERSADFRHSFTFNEVSEFAQDALAVLATIREWRNALIRVNRIPTDVLSLIPTHLSHGDRFRTSFVCRHWRRTFLHDATLWSQLHLSKGEAYVKTLLERAKGSALDITVNGIDSVDPMALLSPHTKQIRHLDFVRNYWPDIQRFSEVNSGLPLLATLRINAANDKEFSFDVSRDMTPPSLPLFHNAVNLKEFFLYSDGPPFLDHFSFPNLTTFKLSTVPEGNFCVSQLLNFLEASPMLQTVDVDITVDTVLEDVPRERVIVLPDVETFSLVVNCGGPGLEIATHISCPSARHTSLLRQTYVGEITPREILPSSVSWNSIVRQYTRSPAEEVTLGIQIAPEPTVTCSLTFRSSDASVIKLGFEVAESDDEFDAEFSEDMHSEVVSQAYRIIRDHPLLANVRYLHISDNSHLSGPIKHRLIANEVRRAFQSVGPLEKLTIDGCDPRSYLLPFLDLPEPYDIEQPFAFPSVKELTILHPLPALQEESMAAIVRLVKSQHALGEPFKRVTVRTAELPTTIAEELRPWVGVADCCEEVPMGDYISTPTPSVAQEEEIHFFC